MSSEGTGQKKENVDPKTEYAIGNVVKLRSGGPEMVIVSSDGKGTVSCGWFNRDDNYLISDFRILLLDLIWKWPGRPKAGDKQ